MNHVLPAAVAVIAVATAVNTLLIFAITRRLKSGAGAAHPAAVNDGFVRVGHRVSDFTTSLLSGQDLNATDLNGQTWFAAFLSPGCPPCDALIAALLAADGAAPAPLFVFVTDADDDVLAAGTVRRLSAVASGLGVIDPEGPVAAAFGVLGYPAMLRIENGIVAASGTTLDAVVPAGALARG